jgi:hypothetical protein
LKNISLIQKNLLENEKLIPLNIGYQRVASLTCVLSEMLAIPLIPA